MSGSSCKSRARCTASRVGRIPVQQEGELRPKERFARAAPAVTTVWIRPRKLSRFVHTSHGLGSFDQGFRGRLSPQPALKSAGKAN